MNCEQIQYTERFVTANGIRLHLVETGTGEPVLLLHGFPEFWYSWRNQLPGLASAGFRAIAVDLRGYNKSDVPRGIASYRTNTLVADVADLIASLNCGPIRVVGHDWGGLIAWRLAAMHPSLVRKIAILNAPHAAAFRRELARNWRQWIKSHYVLLFQLPWLPERLIAASDFAVLERGWKTQPVNPMAFSNDQIGEYKQAFRVSGTSGPLNYYRAAFWHPHDLLGQPQKVFVPTIVIWGAQDPFISESVNDHLSKWVPDAIVKVISEASHWVQNDDPEQVNELLINFFHDHSR